MNQQNNKNIAFYTLGCKVNFSETSFLSDAVMKKGWSKTPFSAKADVYVIHSCILTSQAEKKTRYAIAKAHRQNPIAAVIVMGCVSQLKAEELLKLPGVSHVLGNESKFSLAEVLANLENKKQTEKLEVFANDDMHSQPGFHISWSSNDRTRSFLKIQDGCDCYCNYCIVPFARGKSRSANIAEVMKAVDDIVDAGFNEIVLTGINLGDFGKKSNETLANLIQLMDEKQGLKRIRISSLEPHHFTDDFFQAVKSVKKLMPHFHIPIQAGHNDVLNRMGRNYSIDQILHICNQLKNIHPDVCIAADVITGFPGETQLEFDEGMKFLSSLPLSYLHVFTFSARNDTAAAEMPNHVHPAEKKRRTARMLELSSSLKTEFYEAAKGKIKMVLPENANKNGMMSGFTENYIRVQFPYDNSLVNAMLEVQLTDFLHSSQVYNAKVLHVYE
jgi:threonylcarbamoyladenosine tRNA methylthiotransferase MtaB